MYRLAVGLEFIIKLRNLHGQDGWNGYSNIKSYNTIENLIHILNIEYL